jgi:hypothetical protein
VDTRITEDFNSQARQAFTKGQVIHLSNFDLEALSVSSGSSGATGFSWAGGSWADPAPSRAITMTGGSSIMLTMHPGETFNYISFTVGDFNNYESIDAVFYDQSGTEVYRQHIGPGGAGLRFEITQELPYGLNFSSVSLSSGGSVINAFWIDNVKLGSTQYQEGTGHEAPAANQTIDDVSNYYGGDDNNVFSVANVSVLNDVNSSIHGGGGIDTLKLTGKNQVLDLTHLGDKLESVEVIDITGTGNNTLNLSLSDVLEQGAASLFTDDDHVQMMVKGNSGDRVNLDDLLADGTDPGNWANSGQVTVGGVVYEVYRHDSLDAELLVQQGVQTNLV